MPRIRFITVSDERQRGQSLVLVSFAMVVLLMVAGLAIDVGVWYGQRRHMQNAADAGALAGAYQFCHGAPNDSEADAVEAALDYAEANGADRALTTVDADAETGLVVVTARTPAQLYLARLAVGDFSIPASSAAQCEAADEGCGMWPVAFDKPTYDDESLTGACNGAADWYPNYLGDVPAEVNDKSQFILWAGDNVSWDPTVVEQHCVFLSNPAGSAYKIASVLGGSPMDPGNRGWVALKLLPGFEIPAGSQWADCNSAGNCGSSALNCWLEHGYIGSIAIGDCLATEDGTIDNSLGVAGLREGDAVSVILYDHPGPGASCSSAGNPATCSGSKTYHVAGIGCVRVDHVFDGKHCSPSCSNGRSHDYIEWASKLGLDRQYTEAAMRVGEEYNGWIGNNAFGYGCYRQGNSWRCDDSTPLTVCPARGTGIVVTKLCACPPTYCLSTGGSGTPSAIKAVSLVPVPED